MLTTITHRAMACEFVVMLPESDAPRMEAAFVALECLDKIEADLSVYRPDSEISRLNAFGSDHWIRLSQDTFALLCESVRWSRMTGGAFDITAGPLVRAWGFVDRKGNKPSDEIIRQTLENVGFEHLRLRHQDCSVRFDRPGMEINLGAIGKGYALDRLARSLIQEGLENFLIHGGGSSILAHGDQTPASEPAAVPGGWAVGIAHPSKPNQRLAGIWLRNQALSTSGSGKQFFHHRGRRYGHVIDPRTGYPAGEMLSLTAVADSATEAEACSTAYFLSSVESLRELSAGKELPARMIAVCAQSRQDSVAVIPLAEFDWVDAPAAEN